MHGCKVWYLLYPSLSRMLKTLPYTQNMSMTANTLKVKKVFTAQNFIKN